MLLKELILRNEYGSKLFADFFFFITGFHGFHVFSGVIINIIIFLMFFLDLREKRNRNGRKVGFTGTLSI
jgi:heme/copper-type cytochrome/quinol oxidase subunit 3